MHIIIVGGGGVGYELARNLSEKQQDVVVIEKDEVKARRFRESLDVMVIEDNGANAAVLEQAGVKDASMLIAVTQLDEINMIACMLAKKYDVPITIGRIRSNAYVSEQAVLSTSQLGIDIVINPERVAAMEISKMLHFPDATEIEYFNQGKVMMIGVVVDEDAGITDVPLHKLPLGQNCIVVGISDHNGKFIIPGGSDVIKPGNKIYLLGDTRTLKDISSLLHHEKTLIRQVTILGGGMIAYQLAKLLEESKQIFNVKLIEKDEHRCEGLCKTLQKTLVLQGDATEISMLREEDTDQADAVISATGDDRSNIVAALLARQFGVKKIICEVMKPHYVQVYNALGINSLINPRLLAAAQIMRLIRREDVVALSILQDEKAEVVEVILPESAKVVNRKLAEAGLPRGMLIGSVIRNGSVMVPNGNTVLKANDHLVIFAVPKVSARLDRFFASVEGNGDREQLRNRLFLAE
ncbi:MAG: Trk system potassium transporter TrkA [Firmicutes bacterium]|nr:Trk system potassium transporter TrkA [Bacillota bacterium]